MIQLPVMKRLVSVMVPILIAQLSMIGMNFIDTAMSGHASKVDLAGVSVGASLFMPIGVSSAGILAAGTPMIAQLLGKKEKEPIPEVVRTGLALGFVIALLAALLYFAAVDQVLGVMYLEPEVEYIARYYLLAMAAAVFFEMPVMVLRNLTDTAAGTSVSMRFFLLALPVDGFLNYLFIFGNGGMPRMGGIGAGIATLLTYVFLLCCFLWIVLRRKELFGRDIFRSASMRLSTWKEYLSIGLPNGLGMFMETSLFGFIVAFIAPFGTEVLAAHQAAMNFSGVIYMIPLSCSLALTILVGIEVGAGRCEKAKEFRRNGLFLALCLGLCSASVTGLGRDMIIAIYTEDLAVASLAGIFLLYCAAWQMFDAVACPIQGILRGYKDTKIPFLLMMIAYWAICFPAGFLLDHVFHHGAFSYWQGLDIGVGCSAVLLMVRLYFTERNARKG